MRLQPDKIIQNYKVSHLLGSGGMGEVWAGSHMYLDRPVAIKALHRSLAGNPEIRARFKNEAVTLSQLEHPNIVRLYDYIEEADGVYLVMEFVEGDPLDQYIARKTGPIPEAQAKALFVQMLAGLQYAHARGVIHRDIKPSNFMVTRDGRVKVLDFGIAKALEQGAGDRTKTGARIGTVLYMSPEQVRGQQVDLRADIYAMGVTLFQMVTGRCPYRSDATEYEVYQQIVNMPLPRAVDFYPAVSPQLQAIIDRATAKQAGQRYRDCGEFLAAVEGREIAAAPVPQAPPRQAPAPAPAQTGAPKRARSGARFVAKLLIWLLLLGGLGTAGYIWGWPLLRRELQQSLGRTPTAVAREFLMAVERGDVETATHLATADCRVQVRLTILLKPNRAPRVVEILQENVTGTRAEVFYRYRGEADGPFFLSLERHRGMWEVLCEE